MLHQTVGKYGACTRQLRTRGLLLKAAQLQRSRISVCQLSHAYPISAQQQGPADEHGESISLQQQPPVHHLPHTIATNSSTALQNGLVRRVLSNAARICAMLAICIIFHQVLAPAAQAAVASGDSSNALGGLLSFILHLDHHLSAMIEQHGRTTYAILFAIVFCETGLVLTPFLPGDSLLFAAGAFAGMGKLDVATLMAIFLVSAILGDAVNYAVGNKLGTWAVQKGIVKKEYIDKTEKFYTKYGGKTVVLARFVPIIRTFAPFVAGVGSMSYSKFALYNVLGAVLWSVLFVGGGFFFGNLPFVQKNFTLVVLGIVAVSVVPVIIEIINARKEEAHGNSESQ